MSATLSWCCFVLSCFGTIVLPIWGVMLAHNSNSFEMPEARKQVGGKACYMAAGLYALIGCICLLPIIKDSGWGSQSKRNQRRGSSYDVAPEDLMAGDPKSGDTTGRGLRYGGRLQVDQDVEMEKLLQDDEHDELTPLSTSGEREGLVAGWKGETLLDEDEALYNDDRYINKKSR